MNDHWRRKSKMKFQKLKSEKSKSEKFKSENLVQRLRHLKSENFACGDYVSKNVKISPVETMSPISYTKYSTKNIFVWLTDRYTDRQTDKPIWKRCSSPQKYFVRHTDTQTNRRKDRDTETLLEEALLASKWTQLCHWPLWNIFEVVC